MKKIKAVFRVFMMFILFLTCSSHLIADIGDVQLDQNDSIYEVLERNIGMTIELVLDSGYTITGKLSRVTFEMVHITEISGQEYFDALILLDRVSVVIIRVK